MVHVGNDRRVVDMGMMRDKIAEAIYKWLAILSEEVGEANQAALEEDG